MKIKCKMCKKEHKQSLSNCTWINCECGAKICGNCGSDNIQSIPDEQLDLSDGADDNYWCCDVCGDCGTQGCGMCV